jgi:hypothetical protein
MTFEKDEQFEVRLRVDRLHMTIVGIEFDGTEYEILPKASSTELPHNTHHHHGHEGHHHSDSTKEIPVDQHGQTSKQLLIRQLIFGACTLTFLILCQAGLTLFIPKDHQNLIWDIAPWTLYLDLTVVSLVATIGYLRMYRYAQTNHMTGMMIGMTVGMQVGMMTGGVIGATDGYFAGAMVGVGLGTVLGLTTSWCCGPMAITQSLMSAVMGGTMGAMIVSMMPPDQLSLFMPLFTVLNLAILTWFTRLFFKDCVIGEHCDLLRPMNLGTMLGTSVTAVTILSGLMLLNPKTPSLVQKEILGKLNPFQADEVLTTSDKNSKSSAEMSCGGTMKAP